MGVGLAILIVSIVISLIVGACLGVMAMALMVAAGQDKYTPKWEGNGENT